MSAQSKPVKLTPFGAALAGALGGCFSTAYVRNVILWVYFTDCCCSVVYPLDV